MSRWWASCNHVRDKFGQWELVILLWLRNINKEGMAMLGIKYDRNMWNFCGENPEEYGRRQWRNGFGINEREQQYVHMKSQPRNEKYANGSVGARVRLLVRGGCVPVRGSKGMEWKYDDDFCVCVGQKKQRTWDVLDEKERTMDVIKGYVEVNNDVEYETMKHILCMYSVVILNP